MMRAGIVGCGAIAQVHAAVLNSMPGVELAAACDILPERARALAEKYGARPFDRLSDMLDHCPIDVLHVLTPHYLHAPMAMEAAARGLSVFMEKPAAITRGQWDALYAACRGARLGVCFQNRFNPATQRAREILRGRELGEALGARAFVTWRREAPYYTQSHWRGQWASEGGGALINQSIHTLDLMVYLLGAPGEFGVSMRNRHLRGVIQVEDTVEARIDFGGRCALFYASTGYCTDAPIMLEIQLEKGAVRIEGEELSVFTPEGVTRQRLTGGETLGKGYWGNGHLPCISRFYHCLESGERFENDLDGVRDTMLLTLGLYEAARVD